MLRCKSLIYIFVKISPIKDVGVRFMASFC